MTAGRGELAQLAQRAEIRDATRTVTAVYPIEALLDRAMALAVDSAAPGEVVHVDWSPASDLTSGRTAYIRFAMPITPPGCMEGCPPAPQWSTDAQLTPSELTFTVPPTTTVRGTGTLSVGWSDASGTATSCDATDCRYSSHYSDSRPFTTTP